MATDSFVTPEIPQALRDLVKLSIEQARRAFEIFVATSEKTWKSIETSSQAARNSMRLLTKKSRKSLEPMPTTSTLSR
jgi:hypothetical protein